MKCLTKLVNFERKASYRLRTSIERHVGKPCSRIIFSKLYWDSPGFNRSLLDSIIWNDTRPFPAGRRARSLNSTIGEI